MPAGSAVRARCGEQRKVHVRLGDHRTLQCRRAARKHDVRNGAQDVRLAVSRGAAVHRRRAASDRPRGGEGHPRALVLRVRAEKKEVGVNRCAILREPLPQIGRQERVVLDDQRSRQLPPVYVPMREPMLEREAERPVREHA